MLAIEVQCFHTVTAHTLHGKFPGQTPLIVEAANPVARNLRGLALLENVSPEPQFQGMETRR
jgi:hypothetical protein